MTKRNATRRRGDRLLARSRSSVPGRSRAEAQVTTGTIVGTVKDPEGAVVPGATVTITEVGQGHRRSRHHGRPGLLHRRPS